MDQAQMPRLEEIRANLADRLQEARDQGWLGEVAAIETTLAAAAQKLKAMRERTVRSAAVNLGMPEVRGAAGRSARLPEGSPSPAPSGDDGHCHVAPLKDWASA